MEKGRIKIRIAPSPAPAEIPSSPGSARSFLSIDWRIIPEHERAAPTSMLFNTRGSLISSNILLLVSFPEENIFMISFIEIETLPRLSEIKKAISKKMMRPVSIKTFLDNIN